MSIYMFLEVSSEKEADELSRATFAFIMPHPTESQITREYGFKLQHPTEPSRWAWAVPTAPSTQIIVHPSVDARVYDQPLASCAQAGFITQKEMDAVSDVIDAHRGKSMSVIDALPRYLIDRLMDDNAAQAAGWFGKEQA